MTFQIKAIFGSMLLLIVVGMTSIFYVGKKANDANARTARETEILQKLERILPSLSVAASEHLAYVVMWKPEYRPAYRTALKTLYRNVDSLKPDLSSEDFNRMKGLVHEQVQKLEIAVDLRKIAPIRVTEVMMKEFQQIHEGHDPKQPLKDELEQLKKEHEARLTDARKQALRATATRTYTFFVISGVFILFIGWTFTRVVKEMNDKQRASHAKDRFVAMLSHELRTPLTPVLAMLGSWESDARLSEEQRNDVQLMRRNVELEARLIDDLLDVTRIAKGKLLVHAEAIDVHELLPSVIELFCKSEIDAKNLELMMKLQAERHVVSADPARLQQVFWNVARNAVKFTPERGRITVRTFNRDGRLCISFSDTGIGISKDIMERLFLPFEQGNDEISKRYGLGLGMSISKTLVDLMGGTITAFSEGRGRGATFEIEMDAIAQQVAAAAGQATQDSAATPAGTRVEADILLVEDHADTANVMARLLRGMGHQVQIADCVATARQLNENHTFSLILSDIGLPDGTGIDLMKSIRQSHNANVPAIAMTGFGMDDDVTRSRESGFDLHLTKPVNLARLREAIETLIAKGARERD